MWMEKHVLTKKSLQMGTKFGFVTTILNWKDCPLSWNTLSGKEKIPGAAIYKEGHAW